MARSRSPAAAPLLRRGRNLALELVESLAGGIREGHVAAGEKLPTEAQIVAAYGVSRTVVREALSRLQAAGQVHTRHGIGTFVVGPAAAAPFRIAPEQLATLQDVIAILELRIGVETEAAALAARRRGEAHLAAMRRALDEMDRAAAGGRAAAAADYRFHLEIARATGNTHFTDLAAALGVGMIPRARLDGARRGGVERQTFLRRIGSEHENIYEAIARQDAEAARAAMRTHLANSRERHRHTQVQALPRARAASRKVRAVA